MFYCQFVLPIFGLNMKFANMVIIIIKPIQTYKHLKIKGCLKSAFSNEFSVKFILTVVVVVGQRFVLLLQRGIVWCYFWACAIVIVEPLTTSYRYWISIIKLMALIF